ncbi:hypothetical protein QFZ74_000127 [Streptomyces sp. V3I7]|nr:hypothetical protein [Streptomyces sp. V3I7]MDQ0988899.1 hypothetical protein [Streptomyces sp. V3I7]
MADLRPIAAPLVALGPSGVAIRDRLKGLTPADEKVLRVVGAHLGSLASRDLKARCADGPRTRSVQPDAASTRATRTPKTVRDVRSDQVWAQDSLLLTD